MIEQRQLRFVFRNERFDGDFHLPKGLCDCLLKNKRMQIDPGTAQRSSVLRCSKRWSPPAACLHASNNFETFEVFEYSFRNDTDLRKLTAYVKITSIISASSHESTSA